MSEQIEFKCILCSVVVNTQLDIQTHYLFTHQKHMQGCGTQVAEQQTIEHDKLRQTYKKLKRKLSHKKMYIKKTFRHSIFGMSDSQMRRPLAMQRFKLTFLDYWIKEASEGRDWLSPDNTYRFMNNDGFGAVAKNLNALQTIGIEIKNIELKCDTEDILIND